MNKLLLLVLISTYFCFASPSYSVDGINQGLINYQNKQFSAAKANFNNVIKQNPQNYKALYYLAFCYFDEKDFKQAAYYFEKAYKINPEFGDVKQNLEITYNNLGITYKKQGLFDEAANAYDKAIQLNSNNADYYFQQGYCYTMMKNYRKAITLYEKTLELDPSNNHAENNLKICKNSIEKNEFISKLNYATPKQKAPFELYSLIELEPGVNSNTKYDLCQILDFLWSDVEGRIILTYIYSNKIPIKITGGKHNTNAVTQTRTYKKQLKLYGIIPIVTLDKKEERKLFVNLGEGYISTFRNKRAHPERRLESFEAVIHEFCHTIRSLVDKQMRNSIEEEIVSSMVGFNIANRIFKGQNLTQEETANLSKNLLKSALRDEHRDLPLYNGFSRELVRLGINPPYPYIYQNIPNLYSSIRNEPGTIPHPELDKMIIPTVKVY